MKCGNPSPVVDASSGRVFLHYVQEPHDLAPNALAFVTHSVILLIGLLSFIFCNKSGRCSFNALYSFAHNNGYSISIP